MKLIYVPLVDTFEVQNQNYGSESNIDHLYLHLDLQLPSKIG